MEVFYSGKQKVKKSVYMQKEVLLWEQDKSSDEVENKKSKRVQYM